MAKSRALIIAGGALFALARSAGAADLLPPPPALEPPPPAEMAFNGWYLRGDLGIGASVSTPAFLQTPDPIASAGVGYYDANATNGSHSNSLSAAGIFDIGVGYQFNSWFRADVTGEYRGGSRLQSMFLINDPTQPTVGNIKQEADFYSGDFSSIVGLVNGYADLGTWSGVTPYVGAGVGFASNTLSGLRDQSVRHARYRRARPGRRHRRRSHPVESRLGADGRPQLRRDAEPQARPRLPLSRHRQGQLEPVQLSERQWPRRRVDGDASRRSSRSTTSPSTTSASACAG